MKRSAFEGGPGVRVRRRAWLATPALAALTACASWAPLQSPANGGAPWRELISEHFALFTDVESLGARAALREFETLRHALEQVAFPSGGGGEPRVSIVLFSRHADYEAVGPQGTIGFAGPHLALDIERQPTIVFAGDATASTRRIFVHEEVHEMMHRAYGNTPTWLNEGLATYFSSLHIENDLVVLGDVVPERGGVGADYIPSAAEIVGAGRTAFDAGASGAWTAASFYTGAWLLVHLLRDGPEPYRRRFSALADALNAGRSADEAWRVAMTGIDPSQLESDFRAHVDASSWPRYGQRIQPSPPTPITERPMRPAEVHLLWARLAPPERGAHSLAEREIDEAARLEPHSARSAQPCSLTSLLRTATPRAQSPFSSSRSPRRRRRRKIAGSRGSSRSINCWRDQSRTLQPLPRPRRRRAQANARGLPWSPFWLPFGRGARRPSPATTGPFETTQLSEERCA